MDKQDMMDTLTLEKITQACGGMYYGPDHLLQCSVSSVTIDSRKVTKDGLFIALKGQRVDGHSFIPQVMAAGALCVLSEEKLPDAIGPYILVDSTYQALKDVAAWYRRSLPVKVVGISGSVGKTSTKEMIASILSQKYTVLKTEGNYNNEVGLPLTVLKLRRRHQIAVLEMGISDFGEMTRLSAIARPDVAVLTNIGYAHLENLGSRDGILKAKTEMLENMPDGALVVLNGDDDKLAAFPAPQRLRRVCFSDQSRAYEQADTDSDFSYRACRSVSRGLLGTDVQLDTPHGMIEARIPIPGTHMVHNALAGVAVGQAFSLTNEEIRQGIEALQSIPGRGHIIRANGYTVIDDCYNANPASMKASLSVLMETPPRRVAILGDMFELGETSITLHEEIGACAVACRVQLLICIGHLSAHTARAAREALSAQRSGNDETHILHFADNDAFLQQARSLLQANDTILIKASHGMHFEEIVEYLTTSKEIN